MVNGTVRETQQLPGREYTETSIVTYVTILVSFTLRRNLYPPRDLFIAFPVRNLIGNERVIGRGLHVAPGVNCPCCDSVFARLGIRPIQRPETPGETTAVCRIKLGFLPHPIIDLHLDLADRLTPRRPSMR